jgi:hypothetical protein
MTTINPVRLRDLIIVHFDIEELNSLMFELGMRKDDIAGETIGRRAQELVVYWERQSGLLRLLEQCRQARMAADWDSVLVEQPVGPAPTADPRREAALAELRRFKALLDEGRQTYLRHNEQRGRLWRMIHQNHAEIPAYKGYDDLFYKMYDRLSDDEMELFKIVRGNTRIGTHRVNGRIRDWADSHDARIMFPESSPAVDALEGQLMELRIHLAEWFAKYEETFLPDPKRTLVYLGDEKRQGTRWPPGLDRAVAAVLEGS